MFKRGGPRLKIGGTTGLNGEASVAMPIKKCTEGSLGTIQAGKDRKTTSRERLNVAPERKYEVRANSPESRLENCDK